MTLARHPLASAPVFPSVSANRASPVASPPGVSVVICAHNAAARLPTTLEHLRRQVGAESIQWEAVVVDNASTDGTADAARAEWGDSGPVSLRVVHEPRLGQGWARIRGLAEARYDLVSFVDDDNWVCPEWIALVSSVMRSRPEVGACGGASEAVYEILPPSWLERFKNSLAAGPQGDGEGDVTETRGALWGAGITIRRSAWQDALSKGLTLQLPGREGNGLNSCDDAELCLALRVAGWRLWYEPRLKLQHYLPARRLDWTYFRRLHRGGGASTIGLDGFWVALRHQGPWRLIDRLRWSWPWQAAGAAVRAAGHPATFLRSLVQPLEGNEDVLWVEHWAGRFSALIRVRGAYSRRVREVVEIGVGCRRLSAPLAPLAQTGPSA